MQYVSPVSIADYDPQKCGARCSVCPLRAVRDGLPVPPELNPGTSILVIAEAPGEDEVRLGRPLIGKSGEEEARALGQLGLERRDVSWSHALLCRPPGNNLDAVMASVRGQNTAIRRRNEATAAQNRERRKAGLDLLPLEPEVPSPIECCRPRLLLELRGFPRVIALGKISLQAIHAQHTAGILQVRGTPMAFNWVPGADGMQVLQRVPGHPPNDAPLLRDEIVPPSYAQQVAGNVLVLPTTHPAFILRSRRWQSAFDADHARAARLFSGQLKWRNPQMIFNPDLRRLADYLGLVQAPCPPDGVRFPLGSDQPWKIPVPNGWSGGWWADPARASVLSYDWETDALEPIDCVTRCVQIGTDTEVYAPFFASVESGQDSFYTEDEQHHLRHMLRAWLTGPGWKFGHNSGFYDELVDQADLGVEVRRGADQILGHRNIEGELPHSLRYIASRYLDIHDWKAGDPGVNARSNRVLGVYGCLDTAVTHTTAQLIFAEVAKRGLGGFAAPGLESRILKEPTARYPGTQGRNWWWVTQPGPTTWAQPVPTFVVEDPGAPNEVQPGLVALYPGLITPRTAVQATALAEAGMPIVREGLSGLFAVDHRMQAVCRGMHANGMLVDQTKRLSFLREQSKRFEERRASLISRVEALTGREVWGGTAKKPQRFNPASTAHLSKLYFEDLGLPVTIQSEKTKAASTGDSAVRGWLAMDSLPDDVRALLLDQREFRKAHKILGTYLYPMAVRDPKDQSKSRPALGWGQTWNESWAQDDRVIEDDRALADDGDQDWDDPEQQDALLAVRAADGIEDPEVVFRRRHLYAPIGGSKLRVNGRVHPDWKTHVAVTGRLASSPNLQNIIRWLRMMFVPASQDWLEVEIARMRKCPNEVRLWASYGVDLRTWKPREGHRFVYADSAQIEMRIAASRWQISRYLEAFETCKVINGKLEFMDTHQITMHAIWGDKIWSYQGAPATEHERFYKTFQDGSEFDKFRDLGKRVLYASLFGANFPTVHDVITSAENKKGQLIYAQLTRGEVRVMQRNLLRSCPEIKRGWEWEINTLKAQGYLIEPVTGRRFECLDGYDDLSLVVNRPIQSSNAAIVALATIEMAEKYPTGFAGPYTGLVNHCHDAMTWECPISRANELAADLEDSMTRYVSAYPDVRFSGEAKVLSYWK